MDQKQPKPYYVVLDTRTGLYYDGERYGRSPVATALSTYAVAEFTDAELADEFPGGLPAGWEKVKVGEL